MRLSLATDSLAAYKAEGLSPREVVKAIAGTGFRLMDYDITHEEFASPEAAGEHLRAVMEEYGVAAGQAHAPGVDFANINQRSNWRRAEGCLAFCRAAGIAQVVIHPSAVAGNTREEFFERNAEFYRSLIPAAEESGVRVLIENIGNYADPYFLWNGCDLAELVDMVGHPLFGACWDTGHANHFFSEHTQQYQSIMALGARLSAIHFQDNVGDISDTRLHQRLDMHMMPYMSWASTLNYDAVLKGLVDSGYSGTFSFEPSAANLRRYVEPFVLNGQEIAALRRLPLRLWTLIYAALYEIGRFMLESYGVFEE